MKKILSKLSALPNYGIVGILFFINLVFALLPFILQRNLPPEVPLFYGRPQDEAQLASRQLLALPPLIALVITLINSLISLGVRDSFLRKVLIGLSFSATVLASITILKIIFLVGSF